jgi:hypothetical protein
VVQRLVASDNLGRQQRPRSLGLDAVGNLLRLVRVALVYRRYDLVIARCLELIPDNFEVGRRVGVCASQPASTESQLGACLSHFRVSASWAGLSLAFIIEYSAVRAPCERCADVTRRVRPSCLKPQADAEYATIEIGWLLVMPSSRHYSRRAAAACSSSSIFRRDVLNCSSKSASEGGP